MKKYQHYIPRVYLKFFTISNEQFKSKVFCIDLSDKQHIDILIKGVNDKVFKKKNYYNDYRFRDKEALENMFADEFENKFHFMMKEIEKEKILNKELLQCLISWLYISKMRSPIHRERIESFLDLYLKVDSHLNKDETSIENIRKQHSLKKSISKEFHLNIFYDVNFMENNVKKFVNTVISKHWSILKANTTLQFITNDNPGFSPNLIRQSEYFSSYDLNFYSEIYYVLSPTYCLHIKPFDSGTNPHVNAYNMDILFRTASENEIRYINKGVFNTAYRLLISKSCDLLKPFLSLS